MGRYSGIPELLEQFMDEHEADERWITVHDLRDRFNLTRYHCNTVSGFLRRLWNRSYPKICRYLVKRKSGVQTDHFNEHAE